ncbi:MAG TPA: SMP-30/gluconolactonase/LRE family protein [Burkholderiales bacterium]|nr:SMP-30/gluconolactonase/LRE family protein [Burkholderiales bacterium]
MSFQIECAARGADLLGECPLWDGRELWWVDILAPALRRLDPVSGAVRTLALPEPIGSFAFRRRGGILAAMKSGLYFLNPEDGKLDCIAQPEAALPENRFNDGRCDRDGRFWAGTMKDEGKREPVGALYRLDRGSACARMRQNLYVPNGLCWSPDGRTMYFSDTHRHTIWACDYDRAGGAISRERVFADADDLHPDGACVDAGGCMWSCQYGGWRIVRYTPAGKVDRVLELPLANPTCCCFGGQALDTLYVTSATQKLAPDELARQPLAGSVLALRPGVRGLPEARFAG